MKPKFWQTQSFKELQNEWEAKLKDAGFKDIETDINGNRVLGQVSSNSYRGVSDTEKETRVRYFDILRSRFHEESFLDLVERIIMERRIDGVKIKDISLELKAMGERSCRDTIRSIIKKYERKWYIPHRRYIKKRIVHDT
jgi:hypothetical protein